MRADDETIAAEAPGQATPAHGLASDETVDVSSKSRGARRALLARGDTIGRYVVLSKLGAGGMGVVYAAYDPDLDRKLAIKLLLAADDPVASEASAGASRLLREAQAMAKLSHRNVVAVHDVGTYAGSVFLAMEFVDGGTLDGWLDGEQRPWPAILDKFIAAGRGLAAAHRVGLIHRDFKPANVLVSDDGRVRVADFGLARQAERDAEGDTEPGAEPAAQPPPELDLDELAGRSAVSTGISAGSLSTRLTQTGAFLGTPAYMSPEQFSGAEIDARADQFGFCVALWEALYGERPFAGEGAAALMFQVLSGKLREPPKTARAASVPSWLHKALVRGLARSPDERWPDMDALLRELGRDPRALRKRVIVSLAGLAALVGLSVGLARSSDPTPEPLCQGVEAKALELWGATSREALVAQLDSLDAGKDGAAEARVAVGLDLWLHAWRESWVDACEDTRVRGEQSDELLDRRMICLERHGHRFTTLVTALTEADRELALRAPELVETLGDLEVCNDREALLARVPPPEDPELRTAVEAVQARLDEGNTLRAAGKFDDARALIDPALAEAEDLGHRPTLAEARHARAMIHSQLSEREAAEPLLERAFADALAVGDDRLAILAANGLTNLVQNYDNRHAEGDRWSMIAEGLADHLGDGPLQVIVTNIRASSFLGRGEYQQALDTAELALAMRIEQGAPEGDSLRDRALLQISVAHYKLGHHHEALALLEQIYGRYQARLGPLHPDSMAALNNLGAYASVSGDYDQSVAYFEDYLDHVRTVFGPTNIKVGDALNNLGAARRYTGDFDGAAEALTQAVELRERELGPDNVYVAHTLANLSSTLVSLERLDDALAASERAVAILIAQRGEAHPEVALALGIRGNIQQKREAWALARADLERAIAIYNDTVGPDHRATLGLRTSLASVEISSGHPARGLERIDAVLAVADATGNALSRADSQSVRALALFELGREAEAIALARSIRSTFVDAGEPAAESLSDLDEWLAEHDRAPAP